MSERARDLTEPVDPVHAQAVEAVAWINELFQEAKERVARWEPGTWRT